MQKRARPGGAGLNRHLAPAGVSALEFVAALDRVADEFFDSPCGASRPVAALLRRSDLCTGTRITRGEAVLLIGACVASTTDLAPHVSNHDALPLFSVAMLRFVSPLPLPGLAPSLVRAPRDRRLRVS